MPAPSNYNDGGTVFRIDPLTIFRHAKVDLFNEANSIGDAVQNIFNIWEELELGWVGTSAAEAQDFSDRMNANLRQLFGTKDAPGVLSKIANAIAAASINFGLAEDNVKKMFDSLGTGLDTPAPAGTPPIRSDNGPPVSVQTPPW